MIGANSNVLHKVLLCLILSITWLSKRKVSCLVDGVRLNFWAMCYSNYWSFSPKRWVFSFSTHMASLSSSLWHREQSRRDDISKDERVKGQLGFISLFYIENNNNNGGEFAFMWKSKMEVKLLSYSRSHIDTQVRC